MSDDPMYRRGNPNARPGQQGSQQRPDDRYYQNGQGAPQDPYARGADASRPPAYSGYRQPYPEPDRSRQAPVPDYRQAPPPPPPPPPAFSAPGEGRPVEHRGYHDNGAQDLRPRPPEPPRAPAYDPQAAYYQGEDVYQNQYAEQPQSSQAYAPPPNPAYAPPPPPPPYQAPPQDYGQRDSYRQPAPAPQPMGYGSAPGNGMAQNDDAHSRFFLNSGAAPQAPQERAPAPPPPPLPQTFDFTPASNGNNAAFYAEPEDQNDPGWSHYEADDMRPPASVAPDRRHADDDLDADFFADEEDFEAAHAYAPEKKGGRLKMVLAVLLGTALVGGGGMYAYKTLLGGKRMAGDTATITADNTPFKEQPNDPGGRQFANQGKKIYERLENMTDAQTPDAAAAAAPAPSASPSSFDDRLNQAMQRGRPADDAQLAQPVDPERPRTVKTETYRPDGSRTETPPAAFPGMAVSGESLAPGAGKRQVSAANVAIPPAARPAPAAKPVVAAPAAPAGDGYYLQLSSTQDQARAGTEVNTLQTKYAAVLGGVSLGVREGAVGDKTYYRIKAGPLESKEAGTDLCNRLKTAGMTTLGPCLVNK